MNLYVTKRIAKKTQRVYLALVLDKDNTEIVLSFDILTIIRVTGLTGKELRSMSVGDVIYIKEKGE